MWSADADQAIGAGSCGNRLPSVLRLLPEAGPGPPSRWLDCPGPAGSGDAEPGEACEVDRGGEEGEVGADLEPAPDTGLPPAVSPSHQVGELALDLGPGGPVVGQPLGIAAGRSASREERLMGADRDRATASRGRAPTRQRAGGTGASEARLGLAALMPRESGGPTGRACDGARVEVDREVVLREVAAGSVGRLDLDPAHSARCLEGREDLARPVRRIAVHDRRLGGRGLRELGPEQHPGDRGVTGIARGDHRCRDELGVGIDRDVALVPVEGMVARLVAVAGVGVDRADDPVGRNLAGDSDPPVGSVLEVLAEHRGQQDRRLRERRRHGLALEPGEHGLPVPGERVDQGRAGRGVVPVGGGLAAGAVVVVATEPGAERRLPLARDREHAPDRAAHEGDRVHGRDRVVQRRRVEHPPDAQEPGTLRDLERALEDPVGPVRAGEPCPHVDEHRVREARVVEGQPAAGVLPAGVEREPLDGLAVTQALQALEDHHDRDHQGWHRAPADTRGEQVVEQLVREQRVALARQQGMDRVRPDQRLDEGGGVAEQVGLAGCGSLRHRCAPATFLAARAKENRSCARARSSARQNARFTPAT